MNPPKSDSHIIVLMAVYATWMICTGITAGLLLDILIYRDNHYLRWAGSFFVLTFVLAVVLWALQK